MVEKGLIKNTRTDVKVLGQGELTKKLVVTAHSFSASAREKIERAGGSVTALRPPREAKRRRRKAAVAETAEEPAAEAQEQAEEQEETTD
jgi:large subunit ribosomal protein L15